LASQSVARPVLCRLRGNHQETTMRPASVRLTFLFLGLAACSHGKVASPGAAKADTLGLHDGCAIQFRSLGDCGTDLLCLPEDTGYAVYRCVPNAVLCNDDDAACPTGFACGKSFDDTTYACIPRAHIGSDSDDCNVPDGMGGTVICDNANDWYCVPDSVTSSRYSCESLDDLVECKSDADCAEFGRPCRPAADDPGKSFCISLTG
jgi:hypothetical protein